MSKLEFKQVTRSFGAKKVLRGVNMTWEAGQLYGLLGRNGAGKSTLMKIVNNRLFPTAGKVLLDGKSVTENADAQNRIFLMSAAMLYPGDSRIEQLFTLTRQMYGDFDDELAAHLAKTFGLDSHQRFRKLSTGYRTIAKLIIALCVPCEFVMLDEPVLGLDANNRELFYQELADTFATKPRTFIIASHLIEEIENLVTHVFVLDGGTITLDEDVADLTAKGRVVTGPTALVHEWLGGTCVLREAPLGGMLTAYTLDAPLEKPVPAGVSVGGMDLQRMYLELTRAGGDRDDD